MIDNISYIFFFGTLSIILIYIYIRLKFGFWAIQPVFHVYDFYYMIKPPGIINHQLPEKNKYTNFKNIETIIYHEVSSLKLQRFVNIIRTQYLQNGDNIFNPFKENIIPYFVGHNDKSFISFYNETEYMTDSKNNMITDLKPIGIITTRPIHIIINNGDSDATFDAYYVDYLCVNKNYRKKGIAQQLIQTHHYNQRHVNKKIVVSLFKREEELTGIIPLCAYYTYGFSVEKWTKPSDLSAEYKLLEITQQNFKYLYDFICRTSVKNFDIAIYTEITNINELIKTKNIFVYVIMVDNNIVCAYFFRKSCVTINKGLEVLLCFASINDYDDKIFIQGFKISFWKIAFENHFGFSAVENISHNNIIIENLKQKTIPMITSPTAYFFYNFAYHTFKSNKVLIIN